jgi:hypothetical protein
VRRLLLVPLVTLIAACDSPEAARTRGGGPGADTGNREAVVLMHEGSKPYAKTPDLIPGKGGPVEAANHADALSRR